MHSRILQVSGGEPGFLNLGAVASALYRCEWGPLLGLPNVERRTAFLVRGLCQDHPFVDGNKRTAWMAGLVFLRENVMAVSASEEARISLMVGLARDTLGVDEVEAWFATHGHKLNEGGA